MVEVSESESGRESGRESAGLNWGLAFRIFRHARGRDQQTFARMLHVAPETLSRIETGERAPSQRIWMAFCELEELPPVFLVLLASPPGTLARLDPSLLGILARELLAHLARSGRSSAKHDSAPESARDAGAE